MCAYMHLYMPTYMHACTFVHVSFIHMYMSGECLP